MCLNCLSQTDHCLKQTESNGEIDERREVCHYLEIDRVVGLLPNGAALISRHDLASILF